MKRLFYENQNLTNEQRLKLFDVAWGYSSTKWIDELDCSISYGRRTVNMEYNDFFWELHSSVTHPNLSLVQWRYSYEPDMSSCCVFVRFNRVEQDEHGDFHRLDIDLFGWIYLPVDVGEKLFERYELEEH